MTSSRHESEADTISQASLDTTNTNSQPNHQSTYKSHRVVTHKPETQIRLKHKQHGKNDKKSDENHNQYGKKDKIQNMDHKQRGGKTEKKSNGDHKHHDGKNEIKSNGDHKHHDGKNEIKSNGDHKHHNGKNEIKSNGDLESPSKFEGTDAHMDVQYSSVKKKKIISLASNFQQEKQARLKTQQKHHDQSKHKQVSNVPSESTKNIEIIHTHHREDADNKDNKETGRNYDKDAKNKNDNGTIQKQSNTERLKQEEEWNECYQELRAFYNIHKHTNVPKNSGRLSQWVTQTRTKIRLRKLSKEKLKLLQDIQFPKEYTDSVWDERFQELQKFVDKYGHSCVPTTAGEMGRWVSKQRQQFKKEMLSNYRIEKLNTVGFIWDTAELDWDEKFEILLRWIQQHNYSTRVPFGQGELGWWVNGQRKAYKKGKLSKRRIELLNAVGFDWVARETKKYLKDGRESLHLNDEQRNLQNMKKAYEFCIAHKRHFDARPNHGGLMDASQILLYRLTPSEHDEFWAKLGLKAGENIEANAEENPKVNTGENMKANAGADMKANAGADMKANTRINVKVNAGANMKVNVGANMKTDVATKRWANTGYLNYEKTRLEMEARRRDLEAQGRDLEAQGRELMARALELIARGREVAHYGNEMDPYGREIAPYGSQMDPHSGNIAPYRGKIAPYKGEMTPHRSDITPHRGEMAPHGGEMIPYGGEMIPYGGDIAPHTGDIPPHTSDLAPHTGDIPPHTSDLAPHNIAPYRGEIVAPRGDIAPHRDEMTSHRGEIVPHRGEMVPHRGITAPHSCDMYPHRVDMVLHRDDMAPHRGDMAPHIRETPHHGDELAPYGSEVTPYGNATVPHRNVMVSHRIVLAPYGNDMALHESDMAPCGRGREKSPQRQQITSQMPPNINSKIPPIMSFQKATQGNEINTHGFQNELVATSVRASNDRDYSVELLDSDCKKRREMESHDCENEVVQRKKPSINDRNYSKTLSLLSYPPILPPISSLSHSYEHEVVQSRKLAVNNHDYSETFPPPRYPPMLPMISNLSVHAAMSRPSTAPRNTNI